MSRSFACLASLGALAIAMPAAAEVTWAVAPTNAEMAAVYPEKAREAGIGGGVELACTSTRTGDMTDCDVLGESPRGYGFGIAARKLAGRMQAAGMKKDVEVRISMTFAPELAKGGVVTVKTPKWAAYWCGGVMSGVASSPATGAM